MTRNPLTAEWIKQIHSAFPGADVNLENVGFFLRPNASGLFITGPSGIGKSLTLETVLYLIPQVIYHNQYNGKPFDRAQIVWIKVDAAKDGSVRGLCRAIFNAIDKLLGTSYFKQFLNYTARDAIETLARLLWVFGVGVLVIDEVQRLSLAASGGEKELIQFFSSLQKTLNIPVVLVGTFSAMQLFKDEFSCARSLCSQGDLIWGRYEHDDSSWDYFIEALWKYQFTNIPSPLTKALKKALYEESQGITDIAVKLYMLAQWEVIGGGDEKITPQTIRTVADRHLNMLRPMLRILRSGDVERLRLIKDLHPPIEEATLTVAMRRVQERLMCSTGSMLGGHSSVTQANEPTPVQEIAQLLIEELGIEKNLAWEIANEAVDQSPGKSNLKTIKQNAVRIALSIQDDKTPAKVVSLPGTVIRNCNESDSETAYEMMKKQGLTMDLEQLTKL